MSFGLKPLEDFRLWQRFDLIPAVNAVNGHIIHLFKIDFLNIGTSSVPFAVTQKRRKGWLMQWRLGVVDLLIEAQTRGMQGLAFAMID